MSNEKICPVCKGAFLLKRTQGGQNRIYCYDCLPYGLSRKERKTVNRLLTQKRVEILKTSLGCQVCGYKKCSKALEFHHVFPEGKEIDPSLAARRSWDNFLAEVEKCVILCSNCHREEQSGLIDDKLLIDLLSKNQTGIFNLF